MRLYYDHIFKKDRHHKPLTFIQPFTLPEKFIILNPSTFDDLMNSVQVAAPEFSIV